MSDQLESALVLSLRDTIKWESSLDVPASGTLTPIVPGARFNALDYQRRDRELACRDLIIGAAVIEAAVEVDSVWHYRPEMPRMQGPSASTLPHSASEITTTGSNHSMVRHVRHTSIPYDAARYADADLYGRDLLLYEVLARACASTFTVPPIQSVDAAIISENGSFAWSLANGSASRRDISETLPLNRDLFRKPDEHLADRDNQLAAYVARMAQVLKNPFEYALRLYVEVTGPGSREPETYTLVSDDRELRVWQAEPAITARNQITYSKNDKKLRWTRDKADEVHVPQIYAMAVPGIESGQVLKTLPSVPETKDAQFWRQKAGHAKPEGEQLKDTASYLEWTSDLEVTTGGVLQPEAASLTVPVNSVKFILPGSLPPATYRINLLVEPSRQVSVLGGHNISNTSGTLGGADFAIDIASGNITQASYFVEGGDGIVYNGVPYNPNATFNGVIGVSTFTQVNAAFPSKVRQYAVRYQLPLPAGAWRFWIDYTNLQHSNPDGFGCKVVYAHSGNTVDVAQDTAPLPFGRTNGDLLSSPKMNVDIADNEPCTISVLWTYGTGQFHVRQLYFEQALASAGSYALSTQFGGTGLNATVSGIDGFVEEIRFQGTLKSTLNSPEIAISYDRAPSLPILFHQVSVQSVGTYDATPDAHRYQGWRQECLDRAERVVQQGYNLLIQEFGTDTPVFRDSGSVFTSAAMEDWMSFVEISNPRLREISSTNDSLVAGHQYQVISAPVIYGGGTYITNDKFYCTYQSGSTCTGGVKQVGAFIKSRPGHTGKPALIPKGLYVSADGNVRAYWDAVNSIPTLVACQPWMIKLGAYVAQEEFWMPDYVNNVTVLTRTPGETETPPAPPAP